MDVSWNFNLFIVRKGENKKKSNIFILKNIIIFFIYHHTYFGRLFISVFYRKQLSLKPTLCNIGKINST